MQQCFALSRTAKYLIVSCLFHLHVKTVIVLLIIGFILGPISEHVNVLGVSLMFHPSLEVPHNILVVQAA